MSDTVEPRYGLNASEAAMAWAYARFGGDVDALEVLEADAARSVRQVVESVLDEEDDRRAAIVERWRREDRRWDCLEQIIERIDDAALEQASTHMAPRWKRARARIAGPSGPRKCPWHDNSVRTRRAVVWIAVAPLREHVRLHRPELRAEEGFELGSLLEMDPLEREDFIRRIGVFQLAELARKQDRRSLARLRRALTAEDRRFFDACIKRERPVERLERARLRELFLAVSRQEPDLGARLLHLGLYSIAAGAGERFAAKLHGVAQQLPSALRTLLGHYHRSDAHSGAETLAPAFRRALDEFVSRQ